MGDIDDVRARVNIVDVIGKHVKLTHAGRNFKGLCPFHNEKTPSFMVSSERQIFKCFGCGKGGSVFDFLMEYDHIEFVEALEILAGEVGVTLTRRPAQTREGELKDKIYEVNHLASEYYHYILTRHNLGEKARNYFESRKISDKSIRTFMLGYSPNSWDGLLTYLTKKGYSEDILIKAGLVLTSQKGGRPYDRFRGRVMFALCDHRGNVAGFAGRVLDPTAKDAKYINTSETPVYNKSNILYGLNVTKQAIQKEGAVVVMEGEIDVISSFQAGIGNVVAIKGSALTEGHVHLLRRFTERVIFALDADFAGDSAARRGIEIAEKAGLDMRVVVLPVGKDPDDVAREAPHILKNAITDAIPIYDYYISSAVKRFDRETAFGKKKIAEAVFPSLAKIDNPIVVGHYIKKLSEAIDISEESLMDGMKKVERNAKRSTEKGYVRPERVPGADSKSAKTRGEKLELYMMALLFQGDTVSLFDDIRETISLSDIVSNPIRRILETLEQHISGSTQFLSKDFIDSLPTELVPQIDDALLVDVSELLDDPEKYAREWFKIVRDIRKAALKRTLKRLSIVFDQADGNTPEVEREIRKTTEELAVLEKSDNV